MRGAGCSATAEGVRGETTDNLCQPWEHKLFGRFQVGPSACSIYLSRRLTFHDRATGEGGGAVERERGERTT